MGEACISNIFHVRCLIYAVSPCLNYIMISVAENDLWLCLGSKKKKKKSNSLLLSYRKKVGSSHLKTVFLDSVFIFSLLFK